MPAALLHSIMLFVLFVLFISLEPFILREKRNIKELLISAAFWPDFVAVAIEAQLRSCFAPVVSKDH